MNCLSKNPQDNNPSYTNIIITIAGFLAAFSAISIFSIFNANVDRERQKIEELRIECMKKIDAETERLKKFDNQFDSNFENLELLMNLTSPYSEIRKKREAIKFFIQNPPEQDYIKPFIHNFFKSLAESEKKEKYYLELENLLKAWRMISS